MLKNNKGITLIALVITIIIILILASVATTSGMSAFNTAKFNNAKAQFQAMQNYANSWYEEYKTIKDSEKESWLSNYGEDLSTADSTKVATTIQEGTGSNDSTGFRYFSADYITNTLGIEGISFDFLINVSKATVLVYGGIRYQDKTYYSAKDFGIDVIDYEIDGNISFDTKTEIIDDMGYVIVYNIKFAEKISKYEVQYKKDGDNHWTTLTADKKSTYEYKDADNNTVVDKNAWYILSPISIDDIEGKIDVRIVTKSKKVASNPVAVNIKWVTSITFDTKIEDDKIIAYNLAFLDEDNNTVKLNTYNVRYRNNGEDTWNELTYDSTLNQWYLTVENSGEVEFEPDYIPYIDGELIEKDPINIFIKIFTKSINVGSTEKNVIKRIFWGYDSFVGKVMNETTTLRDRSDKENTITVPKNFKISLNSPTTITEGIIIEDSELNQYIWIPVFTNEKYDWGAEYSAVKGVIEDSNEYYSAIDTALISTTNGYTREYRESTHEDVWYGDNNYGKYGYYAEDDIAQEKLIYYTNGNMTETEYNNLYNNMLKSIYIYGGFYIGRYEMGVGVADSTMSAQSLSRTSSSKEYTASSDNTTNEAPTIDGMALPVSKANAVGYDYITQSQAQMLAKELGRKTDYSNVITSIMFGVQWDAVCVFIEKFDNNNKAETRIDWLTSEDYGWYWGNYKKSHFTLERGYYTTSYGEIPVTWEEGSGTTKVSGRRWLCTTGASNQNSSLNIYDFAGNINEWSLERAKNSSVPCFHNGGYMYTDAYASNKSPASTYTASYYATSRISFFID